MQLMVSWLMSIVGPTFLLIAVVLPVSVLALSKEDQAIYDLVETKLKHKSDSVLRSLERIGNQTIVLESFVASEADPKLAGKIFSNLNRFGTWALPGINDRPSGGKFYVRVNDILFEPPANLIIRLGLEFSVFKKNVVCPFKVSTKEESDVFTLRAESIPQPNSLVHSAGGTLKIFPQKANPGRLWVHLKGHVNLKHWLLYETFPLPYLERETGDRIQIVMDNYLKEETHFRAHSTPAQSSGNTSISSAW